MTFFTSPSIETSDENDILHLSEFYDKHGASIITIRDTSVFLLYGLLFIVVVLSTWIKMQTGEFPFNVTTIANRTYGIDARPVYIFILVTLGFLFIVALRMTFLSTVENNIGTHIENHLKNKGYTREIKIKKD